MSASDVPGNRPLGHDRIKLRISAILWFLLAAGFLLSLPVLLEISWMALVALAIVALVLAFPVAWLTRRFFAGQRAQHWRTSLFKAFAVLLFALSIAVTAPIFGLAVFTALRPLTVPQATLSNGQKTVVFQGMMHVGSEGFYKSVVYDLEQALADGYVLYYEGVTASPDGDKWFSDTLAGGGDLSTNYQQFSEICGLQFQLGYFQLLEADRAARPDRHVSADVSTADMMHEYQRLMASDPAFAAAVGQTKAPAPTEQEGGSFARLFSVLGNITPGQRDLVGTACRGFLTYILGRKTAPDVLDPVILDFRNRQLASRIAADTHDKIYITYGAGHLPGLLRDLQADDADWQIKSVKWLRVIQPQEDLEGSLD